jgi:hypothetical protein
LPFIITDFRRLKFFRREKRRELSLFSSISRTGLSIAAGLADTASLDSTALATASTRLLAWSFHFAINIVAYFDFFDCLAHFGHNDNFALIAR